MALFYIKLATTSLIAVPYYNHHFSHQILQLNSITLEHSEWLQMALSVSLDLYKLLFNKVGNVTHLLLHVTH